MDDLISRQLVIKTLCERRCGNKSKGCPSGFCTESLAVDCIPSAQPYTEAEIQKMQELEQAELQKAYECGRASAQPERKTGEWIPCSERLPDQYGNYLISIDREEPDIGTINPNDPRGWGLCDANGFYWASDKALNITAWMPLPEPWRGEINGDTEK